MVSMKKNYRSFLLLLGLATCPGCGSSTRPIIARLTPLSGSTNQYPDVTPVLVAGSGVSIEPDGRRVVLYDVTAGARMTVAASIEVAGSQLTYKPREPLPADHDFELVVERGALIGEGLDEVDDSERPDEPIVWPFRWGFSTSPRPRVRAAYFDRKQGSGRVTVRFSQPMDPAATGNQIQIVDIFGKALPVAGVVWPDSASAQIDLSQPLDPAEPYRLEVGAQALAENGLRLNCDGDAVDGETDDSFSAAFTGSQPIIHSRQRPAP